METTKIVYFPDASTEISSHLTTRIQNILQCPSVSRYEVTYKLYRKQSERLTTLAFANSSVLYCLCGNEIFEMDSELENVILKLKTWILRQTIKISGSTHDLDGSGLLLSTARRVHVGTISQGPSTKGMVLDIRETPKDLLQSALEPEDQTLTEILGPLQVSLFASTITNSSMSISTGADLSLQIKNILNHVQSQMQIQKAMSYFELFSKI